MDDLFAESSIRDRTLTRADVQSLFEAGPRPLHLVDCDLEEADLAGFSLCRATFERCNFRRTNFVRARLEATVWRSCRAAFAVFTESDLTETHFVASDFNNGSLRGATLSAARFERCKLTGADLSQAKGVDTRFDEVLLVNARLPGHSFRKQVLERIDFGQADLRKLRFPRRGLQCVQPQAFAIGRLPL